jgi:hypothetical protein
MCLLSPYRAPCGGTCLTVCSDGGCPTAHYEEGSQYSIQRESPCILLGGSCQSHLRSHGFPRDPAAMWNIRIPFPDQPVANFCIICYHTWSTPWDNFLINVYHFWITFLINSWLKKQSTFTLKSVNFLIKNVIIFYSKVDCKCVTISNQKMIIFLLKIHQHLPPKVSNFPPSAGTSWRHMPQARPGESNPMVKGSKRVTFLVPQSSCNCLV